MEEDATPKNTSIKFMDDSSEEDSSENTPPSVTPDLSGEENFNESELEGKQDPIVPEPEEKRNSSESLEKSSSDDSSGPEGDDTGILGSNDSSRKESSDKKDSKEPEKPSADTPVSSTSSESDPSALEEASLNAPNFGESSETNETTADSDIGSSQTQTLSPSSGTDEGHVSESGRGSLPTSKSSQSAEEQGPESSMGSLMVQAPSSLRTTSSEAVSPAVQDEGPSPGEVPPCEHHEVEVVVVPGQPVLDDPLPPPPPQMLRVPARSTRRRRHFCIRNPLCLLIVAFVFAFAFAGIVVMIIHFLLKHKAKNDNFEPPKDPGNFPPYPTPQFKK